MKRVKAVVQILLLLAIVLALSGCFIIRGTARGAGAVLNVPAKVLS